MLAAPSITRVAMAVEEKYPDTRRVRTGVAAVDAGLGMGGKRIMSVLQCSMVEIRIFV
jgi:hypothetical protein